MRNVGVTNKEHYGMLWYFLEWSIEKKGWAGGGGVFTASTFYGFFKHLRLYPLKSMVCSSENYCS